MVSIYGPNETDSTFLTQISKTLLEEIDCPLVVGGDFNAVINPALDKSQSDTTANPSSKLLNKFITELNLIDLWRIHLHLHLVIWQTLLSKATYNWGVHKAIHLEEAIRQRKCS